MEMGKMVMEIFMSLLTAIFTHLAEETSPVGNLMIMLYLIKAIVLSE